MKRRVLSSIIALTLCLNLCPVRALAADEGTDGGLCPHHPAHTGECGYASENPDAPCTFACQICLVKDLIDNLPGSVSEDNSGQVQAQLSEIYALYDGLTADEQQQVDLSPCNSLQDQLDGTGLAVLNDNPDGSDSSGRFFELPNDFSDSAPFEVPSFLDFNTNGYTFTGTGSAAIQVGKEGRLYLTGTVSAPNGVGVEVLSGGFLSITEPDTSITGKTYALDIASDAKALLSTGRYSAKTAAIRTADGNYAGLLDSGCAYFNSGGALLLPADAAKARVVVVGPCPGHPGKTYTHTPGATTHTWTCPYCGMEETEKCTFTLDQIENACVCENKITIAVTEDSLTGLIYDGTEKPGTPPPITVTLTHGESSTVLEENAHYEVVCESRTDAGEITVTVTGITFNGTFAKTYHVERDQPGIRWDDSICAVDYDSRGIPVDSTKLSNHIIITIKAPNGEDLHPYLRYFWKAKGAEDTEFTADLPTNAGEYGVKAYIPESQNYKRAETDSWLTLTIKKIPAIPTVTDAPAAKTLTYNREAQELVTAGVLAPGAVAEGAVIEYAPGGKGAFSTEIPTGTVAGSYTVRYQVLETQNYDGKSGSVTAVIKPKSITPVIELSEYSYLYDGTKKDPKITVKDGETVIDKEQYTVTWKKDSNGQTVTELTDAGTYTATIGSKGNYTFTATAKVEIVSAVQNALKITGKPTHVYYGDTITTLDTTGGSGNGEVKWSVTAGETSADIDPDTGKLTVKGTGSISVTAERTVTNYGTVSDTWTFPVEPKPVTAEVTIAPKVYDGTRDIAEGSITAVVKKDDLVHPDDTRSISGLTGAFDNPNAGTNKTVRLVAGPGFTINADPAKYAVSIPATAQADIKPREVTVSVALSDHDLKTDNNGYFYTYDGAEKQPAVTVTGTVTGSDGTGYSTTLAATDYDVSYDANKNAGTATVTVTANAGGNYIFAGEKVNFEIRDGAGVLTKTPQAKDLTYDGTRQDLVTVGTATGGKVVYCLDKEDEDSYSETIPQKTDAGTYTVYYMVKGDDNHSDTAPGQVSVTIKQKEIVSPKVTVSGTYTYNGDPQEPDADNIKVEDKVGDVTTVIPAGEYTVTFRDNTEAGPATAVITNANGGNYIVNGTGTFTIKKADASVDRPPAGNEELPYNGTAQELVTAGKASGGTMVYSLSEDGEYSPVIPAQTARGSYTVWYKVQGDRNHNDTGPASVDASIIVNTVTEPTIKVTPEAVTFNGKKQEPTVTVKDDKGLPIDGSEYTVTYADAKGDSVTEPTNVGKYTLTITSTGANYTFNADNGKYTAQFEILPADQTPMTITGQREHVYYGDKILLGTSGGSVSGTVTWEVENPDGSDVASFVNGVLTIKDVGPVKVTATSTADGYTDQTATWPFYAEKKPVTAVVTADPKTYDGVSPATTTVTATLQNSDLVSGDTVKITLSGSFEDPNAGTNKKVTVDSTNPVFTGTGKYENYSIAYPSTAAASIWKAPVTDVRAPTAKDLEYTGLAQELVTPGSSTEGTLEYSTDGIVYSAGLPTGIDAHSYDVWYRVKGDGNHNDTEGTQLPAQVTIAQQTVTDPKIELKPADAAYDGAVHKPDVTVRDNNGRVIPPDSEYTVTYGDGNWKDIWTYTVTITDADADGGNYDISKKDASFEILMMGQNPLAITNQPDEVHYGDTFTLSTTGGSGTGDVSWESSDPEVAAIDAQSGLVTILKSGPDPIKITATKDGGGNYAEATAEWKFAAEKKPVTAVVTAKDKAFDSKLDAELVISWKDGDLLNGDTITLTGTFDDANVGDNKTVHITAPVSDKYEITYNTTTTASITPADVTVNPPTMIENLTYTGQPRPLINDGTASGGTMVYSLDKEGEYSPVIPAQMAVGDYTVWYKVRGDSNHKDTVPASVSASIIVNTVTEPTIKVTPESVTFNGTAQEPAITVNDDEGLPIDGREYTVTYTDAGGNSVAKPTNVGTYTLTITSTGSNYTFDADNGKNTAQFEIVGQDVTNSPQSTGSPQMSSTNSAPASRPSASSTFSTPTQTTTTVQNGMASTVMSAADGSRLVQEASVNQSRNVVIKPEITGNVTKAEVSIPSSTVSQLSSKTDAALTVSSPVANVTIPNEALGALSQAGGTVSVAAEQVEQSVVVTVAAGGEPVEQVPGGLTVTVPVEDTSPGTVAVLVHDDGTRETIRKSVAGDGVMNIPLSGSATVEIVDNSKDFDDVPPEGWEADAVDFASSHELFSGTSETTFSPDAAMSRGMLATVLYRLEGSPDLGLTDLFNDVSNGAWYEEGVAWAAENDIADGYGDGQFGPDDNITREQFVVMLWRYAGSPESGSQVLDFADADQASSFALEALCWAVENGILHGVDDGTLDPSGMATRAQAAQLLKNFMENT